MALTKNGKKKPGNVTPELIAVARRFIESGQIEDNVKLLHGTFEV